MIPNALGLRNLEYSIIFVVSRGRIQRPVKMLGASVSLCKLHCRRTRKIWGYDSFLRELQVYVAQNYR